MFWFVELSKKATKSKQRNNIKSVSVKKNNNQKCCKNYIKSNFNKGRIYRESKKKLKLIEKERMGAANLRRSAFIFFSDFPLFIWST